MKTIKSPLKKYVFNPLLLKVPLSKYDLAKLLRLEEGKQEMETIAEVRDEDGVRAACLLASNLAKECALGEWLESGTIAEYLPLSPASAFFMHTFRRRLLGSALKLFSCHASIDYELKFFTIIHPKWRWKSGELHNCSPRGLKKAFRRYLERAGVVEADGLLFAAIHGEFDGEFYQLHFHGIVSGQKTLAIEKLRNNFGFVSSAAVYRPIEIVCADNLPRLLAYSLQSFWPYHLRYHDKKGKQKKKKNRQRLPNTQHREYLMWMASQNVLDLITTIGMRIKGGELKTC